ncbi:MAG TPA: glucose 1-dehydrogenase [Kiloniellales bacterium]|nr:glucose 1-dehydrogenase [Kiloniellales bacterium]
MRLQGKCALITGGGAGIGRATALKFAAEGAAVAIADLRQAAAEETADLVAKAGGRAVACAADVTDEASCEAMVRQAEMGLGAIDTLINNAGVVLPDDSGPEDTPLSAWSKTLAVNLTGVFLCCRYGIPAIKAAGGGSIVNLASIVALVGSAYPQLAYTAAKGGVLAMTREMAIMYARQNIRVNAVCPGPTATELVKTFLSDEEKWLKRRRYMPMGRLGQPEEIANVIAFLASSEASYMNGAAVTIDGGITAAYVIKDE